MNSKTITKFRLLAVCMLVMAIAIIQPASVFPGNSPLNAVVTAEAASAIRLNKTKVTLNVKKTTQLKVSGTTKKVTWSSSDNKVATVTSKGKVTAKKKGTATITARVGGKKYTCKVTVKQPVTSVTLNKKSCTLKKKGATVTLKATVKPTTANNRTVKWTTSNKKVATVNSKGKVTAVGNGTATITATAADGSNKNAACKITVNIPVVTPTTTNKVTVQGVSFDLSHFPTTVTITNDTFDSGSACLSVIPEENINPADITYKIANGTATLLCTSDTPNLYTALDEQYIHEYYVSDWNNMIAYVTTSYEPYMYLQYRVEIYNQLKTGSFPVSVYYKNDLIRTCNVTVASTYDQVVNYRNWMNDLEKKAWTNDMTTEEKLLAIKNYVYDNYSYTTDSFRCNDGAKALLYAARDLGLKARYRFVGPGYDYAKGYGDVYYHFGSAFCGGHVCAIITINGEDKIYESQGHPG